MSRSCIALPVPYQFLFFIFLALPLVCISVLQFPLPCTQSVHNNFHTHAPSLFITISCPMHPVCS
jgi:hypothetical protein